MEILLTIFAILISIGLFVVLFMGIIESKFCNIPSLKVHNDEIDIADVTFHFKDKFKGE